LLFTPFLVLLTLALTYFLGGWWDFARGVERHFVAESTCAPRDGAFKSVTISVRGVVPRHEDLARRFPAEILLLGNDGKSLRISVTVGYVVWLTSAVPAAELPSGIELTGSRMLKCFQLVSSGKATNGPASEPTLGLVEEFFAILRDAGAGPKGGPISGTHFELLSHTSRYTNL
jgi:hypothetical protein